MDRIHDLVEMLAASRRAVAFTGAGVSTLSGVPDFRGADGLYARLGGPDVFDIDVFRRDPSVFYGATRDIFYPAAAPRPSLVHRVCARLEAAGRLRAVITQNIDMLHQQAGSRRVIELHGSPAWHRCPACDRRYDFAWARERVRRDGLPRCEDCRAVVKPEVTFFGEMLPEGALEEAWTLAGEADLMLVLGSSLVVQPAASVPRVTVEAGGRLVIVNRDPTPLDRHGAPRFDDLEAVFTVLDRAF